MKIAIKKSKGKNAKKILSVPLLAKYALISIIQILKRSYNKLILITL